MMVIRFMLFNCLIGIAINRESCFNEGRPIRRMGNQRTGKSLPLVVLDSSKMTSKDKFPINLSILCYNANNISPICKTYKAFIEWKIKKHHDKEPRSQDLQSGVGNVGSKMENMKIIEEILCSKEESEKECQSFLKWKALNVHSNLKKNSKNMKTSHPMIPKSDDMGIESSGHRENGVKENSERTKVNARATLRRMKKWRDFARANSKIKRKHRVKDGKRHDRKGYYKNLKGKNSLIGHADKEMEAGMTSKNLISYVKRDELNDTERNLEKDLDTQPLDDEKNRIDNDERRIVELKQREAFGKADDWSKSKESKNDKVSNVNRTRNNEEVEKILDEGDQSLQAKRGSDDTNKEDIKTNKNNAQEVIDDEKSFEKVIRQMLHDEKTEEIKTGTEVSNSYDETEYNSVKQDTKIEDINDKSNGEENDEVKQNFEAFIDNKKMNRNKSLASEINDDHEEGQVETKETSKEDEISAFLRACQEGKENEHNCEYVKSFVNSEQKTKIANSKTDGRSSVAVLHNRKKDENWIHPGQNTRQNNSKDVEELFMYIKACEDGKLDVEHCESLKSLLMLEENLSINAELETNVVNIAARGTKKNAMLGNSVDEGKKDIDKTEKNDHRNKAENYGEDSNEILEFLKDCEEGKEDQEECKSFKSYLKARQVHAVQGTNNAEINNATVVHASMTDEGGKDEESNASGIKEGDNTDTDNEIDDSNEIESFLKDCEEGKEDKDDCEYLKSNSKSQDAKGNMKNVLIRDTKTKMLDSDEANNRHIHDNGQVVDEILQFLKECEDGEEDEEDCNSFKSYLKLQKHIPYHKNNTKNVIHVVERNIGQNNASRKNEEIHEEDSSEVEKNGENESEEIKFLKDCREGNEDQEECESFLSYLKSEQKFPSNSTRNNKTASKEERGHENSKNEIDLNEEDRSKDDTHEEDVNVDDMHEGDRTEKVRDEEDSDEEYNKVLIFLQRCEKGKEDKEDCEALNSLLQSQKELPINGSTERYMAQNSKRDPLSNETDDSEDDGIDITITMKRDKSKDDENSNETKDNTENVAQENESQENGKIKYNEEGIHDRKQQKGKGKNRTKIHTESVISSVQRDAHMEQERSDVNRMLRNLDETIYDNRKSDRMETNGRKKEKHARNRHKKIPRQNHKALNRGKRQANKWEAENLATNGLLPKNENAGIAKEMLAPKRNGSRKFPKLYKPNDDLFLKEPILKTQRGRIAERRMHLSRTVVSNALKKL